METPETPSGRGPRGRFAKGNPGNPNGPGRPKRSTEREYLDATIGSCSLADWSVVASKAVSQAKAGDRYARDWLTRILLPNLELIAEAARSEGKASTTERDFSKLTVEEALMLRSLMLKASAPEPQQTAAR